jgi:tetratricopeptide (TPR) repeat protein
VSLLVDLLSKTKTKETTKDVPPGLRRTVVDGSFKKKNRRKTIVLSVLILIVFLAGFATIYLMESLQTSLETTIAAKTYSRKAVPPPNPSTSGKSVNGDIISQKAYVAETATPGKNQLPGENTSKKIAYTARDDQTMVRLPEKTIRQNTGKDFVKETPNTETSQKRTDKDVYLYAARHNESRGELKQALENYMKALELDTSNYVIMNNISGIYLRIQSYGDALSYSKRALDVKANYIPALINGGIANISSGNAAKGEEFLSRAVSIEPFNKAALFNLAVMWEKEGKLDKAYESYYKLSQMRDIDGCLGAARIMERQGQNLEAARFYREILAIDNAGPAVKQFANQRLSQLNR